MPYELLAELVEYPGPGLVSIAERCRAALDARLPEAARLVEAFASYAAGTEARQLEELYTRSFDLSAPCCLDLGWQLFGETYDRGPFLVRLRLATRAHGIDPGAELPDHLSVVLRLLARLTDEEEPALLAEEALVPALEKMLDAFAAQIGSQTNPYRGLLRAALALVRADWIGDARSLTPTLSRVIAGEGDRSAGARVRLPIVDDDGPIPGPIPLADAGADDDLDDPQCPRSEP